MACVCQCQIVRHGARCNHVTYRNRDCFSDEHYFPTLLAVKGLDQESDCKGLVMNVDWSRGGPHPRAYTLREVSAARCVAPIWRGRVFSIGLLIAFVGNTFQ